MTRQYQEDDPSEDGSWWWSSTKTVAFYSGVIAFAWLAGPYAARASRFVVPALFAFLRGVPDESQMGWIEWSRYKAGEYLVDIPAEERIAHHIYDLADAHAWKVLTGLMLTPKVLEIIKQGIDRCVRHEPAPTRHRVHHSYRRRHARSYASDEEVTSDDDSEADEYDDDGVTSENEFDEDSENDTDDEFQEELRRTLSLRRRYG